MLFSCQDTFYFPLHILQYIQGEFAAPYLARNLASREKIMIDFLHNIS